MTQGQSPVMSVQDKGVVSKKGKWNISITSYETVPYLCFVCFILCIWQYNIVPVIRNFSGMS